MEDKSQDTKTKPKKNKTKKQHGALSREAKLNETFLTLTGRLWADFFYWRLTGEQVKTVLCCHLASICIVAVKVPEILTIILLNIKRITVQLLIFKLNIKLIDKEHSGKLINILS